MFRTLIALPAVALVAIRGETAFAASHEEGEEAGVHPEVLGGYLISFELH